MVDRDKLKKEELDTLEWALAFMRYYEEKQLRKQKKRVEAPWE